MENKSNLDPTLEELIFALESKTSDPTIRRSFEGMSAILAEDFFEVGASGRKHSRNDVLEVLASDPGGGIEIYDFNVTALGVEHALATYRAKKHESGIERDIISWRCSIWRKDEMGWRMIYHQGTPLTQDREGSG